jgi:hypothetical protein
MKVNYLALVFLLALPAALFGQQKFALVIGNGAYTSIGRLNNPVNDAADVKGALEGLGFSVELVTDGSLRQMTDAVDRFARRLSGAADSYGFFFYAGHGVQSNGENYLIPVNANIRREADLAYEALHVQRALDYMQEAGNALNVVVLDACRDNPFSWKRGGSRGLSVVSAQPPGSIIVYATSAGSTAADGAGRNGIFTAQLLGNLKNQDLEVYDLFRRTMADVRRASNNTQVPAIYSQLDTNAWLGRRPAVTHTTPAVSPQPAPAPVRPTPPQPAPVRPAATPQRPAPDAAKVYKIGDIGPAGGWIFYDKGSFSDGWRYLEAAPRDAGGSIAWGLYGKDVAGTEKAVGSGRRNTQLILEALRRAGETGRAAQICAAFEAGGFKDWFLPSKGELDLMYKNLKTRDLGNFQNWYWSSSELDNSYAWGQRFSDGDQVNDYKTNANSVRAVRAF